MFKRVPVVPNTRGEDSATRMHRKYDDLNDYGSAEVNPIVL